MNPSEIIAQTSAYASVLFNLAPAPFTVLIVIVVCYALRLVKRFPNDWIPVSCLIIGIITFCVLNERALGMTAARFYFRSVMTGLVLGFAAWAFHDYFLSQIENRIPILKTLLARVDGTTPPGRLPDTPKTNPIPDSWHDDVMSPPAKTNDIPAAQEHPGQN
jgi:hypothetical protein